MNAEDLEILKNYLRGSGKGHSFGVIRKFTGLLYSDAAFQTLIAERADTFRPCTTVRRNKQGDRVRPGRPGIALIGA